MDVKILLVDDHRIFTTALRALLEEQSNLTVVGISENGRSAVKKVVDLRPDVVVMDLRLPDLNGIEAARQTIAALPGVKVIGLSANTEERLIIEMFHAGACGYVCKDAAFEELVEAIKTVIKGKLYLSAGLPGIHMEQLTNGNSAITNSVFSALSPREREVLQLIAEGGATKEVAAELHMSVKTAETHRRNLMGKLQIDNVADLTKYALREGLIQL